MPASSTRWYGVVALSWRLITLAPIRSREMSFCWVSRRLV